MHLLCMQKKLTPLGEDVCKFLELEPLQFTVIRQVRPKFACSGCDVIVQEPAPSRPIERGMVGPDLLARVIVGKYADHTPLYRQSEIYARQGVEIDRPLLSQWVGGASRLLTPLSVLDPGPGALYQVESEIRGKTVAALCEHRRQRSRPGLDALHVWWKKHCRVFHKSRRRLKRFALPWCVGKR